jgi:iron complex transport system substrate-binding protein
LELADHFGKVSQYLHKLTADIEARKRVYFEAIHSRMKTFSPDSMAIFTLQTAGGINVAADAKPVRKTNIAFYGKERILARAAEIDVYLAQYGAMNTPTVAMIRKEPGYRAIKAIRDNEIYIVDEHIVSRPTVRLLDGIFEIGKILYPDRFGAEAATVLQNAKQF